ncbi:8383_t:CDS:1 [Funneliformis mosseae]|uniref:8383_t:CDS:1 n=1 Tax=Funneliformis mosseae TaxID=27381 RepID=A0A9N9BX80_FUNMO|nr:8383_t:CDS:1 [Funneliformis mosseae]
MSQNNHPQNNNNYSNLQTPTYSDTSSNINDDAYSHTNGYPGNTFSTPYQGNVGQQPMMDYSPSTQFYPAMYHHHANHANEHQNPPLTGNNNISNTTINSPPGIFVFNIPGFRIIVIPDSSSNFVPPNPPPF